MKVRYLVAGAVITAGIISSWDMAYAGNWNSGSSNSGSSGVVKPYEGIVNRSATYVVPNDVMSAFKNVASTTKEKYCSISGPQNSTYVEAIAGNPPERIKGWNSRMDNKKNVEGSYSAIYAMRWSKLVTDSMVNENSKEIALESLYKWANAGALTKTWNCFTDGKCGNAWKEKDGSDLNPMHDIDHTFHVMHKFAYGYYFALSDYKVNDPRHAVIQNWLKVYFGNPKMKSRGGSNYQYIAGQHTGYRWIELLNSELDSKDSKDIKSMIKKIIDANNKQILKDGSIKNRTTRGDRSLWYHWHILNEIVLNMETARRYDVKIPAEMHEKVEKAADIFVKGFADHTYMDKWAKVAFQSTYTPGLQHFKNEMSKIPNSKSWVYIFQYRYPNSPVTVELAKITANDKQPGADGETGIGYGCIYGSLLK